MDTGQIITTDNEDRYRPRGSHMGLPDGRKLIIHKRRLLRSN